jgi:hypothetical protein
LGLTLKEHYILFEAFGIDIFNVDGVEVKNYIDVYNLKLKKEEEEV